jgi:hypothetical protein
MIADKPRCFFQERAAIGDALIKKWAMELDYRLIKDLWAFHGNRIAVLFQYEHQNPEPVVPAQFVASSHRAIFHPPFHQALAAPDY